MPWIYVQDVLVAHHMVYDQCGEQNVHGRFGISRCVKYTRAYGMGCNALDLAACTPARGAQWFNFVSCVKVLNKRLKVSP